MNRKIKMLFVLICFTFLFLSACSQTSDAPKGSTATSSSNNSSSNESGSSSEQTKPDKKVELRIALTTEEGGLGDLQTKVFKSEIEKNAPGYFDVKIFAGSKLGTGTENVQALTTGDLEAALLGSEGASVDKKLSIFEIPWLFNGFKEFEKGTTGPLFDQIKDTYNKHNLEMVAIYGSGFRDILTKEPVNKLEDLKGMKIRLAPSPERLTLYKLLKAVPVTIQWADTYISLDQGTVDGVEAFPVYLKSGKMYEQAKYLADMNYVSAPMFMTFSKRFWDKLPSDVQKALAKAGKDSIKKANELALEYEKKDTEFMANNGVKIIPTDLKGYEQLRVQISEAYIKKFGDNWLKLAGVLK